MVGANGNPIRQRARPLRGSPYNCYDYDYDRAATTTTTPIADARRPAAATGTEAFDISGPVFTNNNGEAENVLRTRRETTGTAQVRAFVPNGSGFVESETLSIPIL